MMTSMWRFLSIPPSTHEQRWWPSPRWALRGLAMYAIAALCGGLLFVLCTALLAVFSPPTPTVSISSINVFGYIDLAKIITIVCGILAVSYILVSKMKLRKQILVASTIIPALILGGLMLADTLTSETFSLPGGVKVKTNRIDAEICQYIDVINCRFPRINCKQFRRLPDGAWISSPNATLVYPDKPGSFASNEIDPHSFIINGPNGIIDLTEYLDRTCRSHLRAFAQ